MSDSNQAAEWAFGECPHGTLRYRCVECIGALLAVVAVARYALENIQGMLDGDDIPSTAIRDSLRAALAALDRGSAPEGER